MHSKELAGVHLQRSDLRRTRMELAAATEEANQARQELRVVRAELSRSRVAQATVSLPMLPSHVLLESSLPITWRCISFLGFLQCHNLFAIPRGFFERHLVVSDGSQER